jgi:hypothetical protein
LNWSVSITIKGIEYLRSKGVHVDIQ